MHLFEQRFWNFLNGFSCFVRTHFGVPAACMCDTLIQGNSWTESYIIGHSIGLTQLVTSQTTVNNLTTFYPTTTIICINCSISSAPGLVMIMVNTCIIWNTFVEKREHTGYPIVIYICNIGKCVHCQNTSRSWDWWNWRSHCWDRHQTSAHPGFHDEYIDRLGQNCACGKINYGILVCKNGSGFTEISDWSHYVRIIIGQFCLLLIPKSN